MHVPLAQYEWQGQRIRSVTPDRILKVEPEPGYPTGRRANHLAEWWKEVRKTGAPGVLTMDVDIVADPDDIYEMREAAESYPEYALIAAHKLWPASTGLKDWVWAFGPMGDGIIRMTQHYMVRPEWIAAGLVYYPRRLMDLALPHMPAWSFGQADITLSQICREQGIPMRPVTHARPKHVHFNFKDDYLEWTRQP